VNFKDFAALGIEDTTKKANDKIKEYGDKAKQHKMWDGILGWLVGGLGIATGLIGLASGLPAWVAGIIGVATGGVGAIAAKANFGDWKLYSRGVRKLEKEKADYTLPGGGGDYKGKTQVEKDQLFQERVYSLIETVEGA
jgi:hypothetical protein